MIVAMGKAVELAQKKLQNNDEKVRPLRDTLEESILASIPDTELNVEAVRRQHLITRCFHGDLDGFFKCSFFDLVVHGGQKVQCSRRRRPSRLMQSTPRSRHTSGM